jgi:hypothetical protein
VWHVNCSYKTTFWFFNLNRKEVYSVLAPAVGRTGCFRLVQRIPAIRLSFSESAILVAFFIPLRGQVYLPVGGVGSKGWGKNYV